MDEIFNAMESGEAAIGAYYAGDYFTMVDAQADNVDLQFYYPEPTNYFVDAMCIPSCCANQELARDLPQLHAQRRGRHCQRRVYLVCQPQLPGL